MSPFCRYIFTMSEIHDESFKLKQLHPVQKCDIRASTEIGCGDGTDRSYSFLPQGMKTN